MSQKTTICAEGQALYESPAIEVIEISVEQGFAISTDPSIKPWDPDGGNHDGGNVM